MFMPASEGFLPDYIGFSIHSQFGACGDYVLHGWFLGREATLVEPLC